MFFTLFFVVGLAGFATLALLSFGHIGGLRVGHHAAGPATGSHLGGAHAATGAHGHAVPGHHVGHNTGVKDVRGRWSALSWFMVTPIDIFSYCLGFGAAGLVLKHLLQGNVLVWVAVACAVAYNLLLIRPMMNLATKFVSRDSEGLEGTVSSEAEALGRFDHQGRGLVQITLDGQVRQLLAMLDPQELERGVTVAKGDKVMILEVDGARNTCRVSRDLAA